MATYTETTLEKGELGEELFAGVVMTVAESAVVLDTSSVWLILVTTDTAVITGSSIGEQSKVVNERAVITSTSSTTKKFTLTVLETAKLLSTASDKSMRLEVTEDSAELSDSLALAPLYLRASTTEAARLSSSSSPSRRSSETITDSAVVTDSSPPNSLRETSTDEAVIVDSSTTVYVPTAGSTGSTALESAVLNDESVSRMIHRVRSIESALLGATISARKITRHTLTEKFKENPYVRTFRA